MTIFLNADGSVALCLPSTITQGSNNANKIVLIGPFDKSNVITVAFSLQNGKTYGPRLVDPYTTEEIDLSSLKNDAYAMTPSEIPGYKVDGAILYAWTYTLNSVLLSSSGTLNIQFFITGADTTLSSQLIQATINPGIKDITLPEVPTADVYTDIIAYLNNFNAYIDEVKQAKASAQAAEGSAQAAAESASAAATSENESRLYAHGNLGWNEDGEPNWAFPDRWAALGKEKLYSIMKETQNYPGTYSALYYAIDAAISKELAENSKSASAASELASAASAIKAEKDASDISDIDGNSDNYPGSWYYTAEEWMIHNKEITEIENPQPADINEEVQKIIDSTRNRDDPESGDKKSALYYAIDARFSSVYAGIQKEKAETAIVEAMSGLANSVNRVVIGSTVTMADVSPISHTMKVKVKPKNILPYPYTAFVDSNEVTINGVTFTNNGDGTITANGKATATASLVLYNFDDENRLKFDNSSLVLSGSPSSGGYTSYYLSMTTCLADGTKEKVINYSGSTKLPYGYSSSSQLKIVIYSGKTCNNVTFKPQLEYGTRKTDYEAPIGDLTALKVIKKNAADEVVAEYTPKSDGTVDGVTSLYPTTVLTTDRGTVPIECKYNIDTNKAIPKIYKHNLEIYKSNSEYDSEGNLVSSNSSTFYAYLTVYITTDTPITSVTDISRQEFRQFSVSDFRLRDDDYSSYRPVDYISYDTSNESITVYYFDTAFLYSSLVCEKHNYTLTDTVTEV